MAQASSPSAQAPSATGLAALSSAGWPATVHIIGACSTVPASLEAHLCGYLYFFVNGQLESYMHFCTLGTVLWTCTVYTSVSLSCATKQQQAHSPLKSRRRI